MNGWPLALCEERAQQRVEVLLGDALLDEADLALVQEAAILVLGIDHGDALGVVPEVALDERQRTASNRAEADHHDRAGDRAVKRPVRHY